MESDWALARGLFEQDSAPTTRLFACGLLDDRALCRPLDDHGIGLGAAFLQAGLGAALLKAPMLRLFVCGLLDDHVL
jgi:hypothetical protein